MSSSRMTSRRCPICAFASHKAVSRSTFAMSARRRSSCGSDEPIDEGVSRFWPFRTVRATAELSRARAPNYVDRGVSQTRDSGTGRFFQFQTPGVVRGPKVGIVVEPVGDRVSVDANVAHHAFEASAGDDSRQRAAVPTKAANRRPGHNQSPAVRARPQRRLPWLSTLPTGSFQGWGA